MERTHSRYGWINFFSLVLVLPAAVLILVSVLKYGFGLDGPFSLLERLGIEETLGWNINLLILFGPLLSLLFSVLQVLGLSWNFNSRQFDFRVTVQKKWFPLLLAVVSAGILAILFFYLLGENC